MPGANKFNNDLYHNIIFFINEAMNKHFNKNASTNKECINKRRQISLGNKKIKSYR